MKKVFLICIFMMFCNSNLFSQKPINMTCKTYHFMFFFIINIDLQNVTNDDLYVPVSHWWLDYVPWNFPDNRFCVNYLYFYDKHIAERSCTAEKTGYPIYKKFPKILLLKPKRHYRINFFYFGGAMYRMYKNEHKIDPELNIHINWANKEQLNLLRKKLHLKIKKAIMTKDIVNVFLLEWLKHPTKGILMSDIDIKNPYEDSPLILECFSSAYTYQFPFPFSKWNNF